MIVIHDKCEYFFEKTTDLVLLKNAYDSEIKSIELKKYSSGLMEFLFDFYKKDFRVDLKNNAVVYYKNAAFEIINDFLQNDEQKCKELMLLSLYLGYTKLSSMLILFKFFMPF